MNLFGKGVYTLKKSKHILNQIYRLYRRKKKNLSVSAKKEFDDAFAHLQREILNKNRQAADIAAKQLEAIAKHHIKKSSFDHGYDLFYAVGFALLVAVLIRSVWFEPFEIPTGSMRPTLKEEDRLLVSKTNFGINIPLTTGHFYFEPDLVKRGGIFIFTGENMDIPDVDTLYFYLFPGKKQYVKRLMGKPGDTLYFYGGLLYGIDSEGNNISSQFPLDIEHIPFITFDHKLLTSPAPVNGIYSPSVIYQMDEPVVRLSLTPQKKIDGEIINAPQIHQPNEPPVTQYGDLWGIKNFAMARLLTADQVRQLDDYTPTDSAILYLELRHDPNFANAKLIQDPWGRIRPTLGIETSIIPLQESHVKEIFNNLYTARFYVKNGYAYRYGSSFSADRNAYHPFLPDVPDGCYEFYYGKLYQVKMGGITEELPSTHPLAQYSPDRTQLLYNLGIEFDTRFAPQHKFQFLYPNRYSYYRNGDLYLLGAPILKKDDPTLVAFTTQEQSKSHPFIDHGAPLKSDGSLNIDFIKQYGLLIPPKSYLALGDNHAMSSDSRDFGFVPEDNIRGAPDFIFWPPGSRWGKPDQPPYPLFTAPRVSVWAAAIICCIIWYIRSRRRTKLLLQKEK